MEEIQENPETPNKTTERDVKLRKSSFKYKQTTHRNERKAQKSKPKKSNKKDAEKDNFVTPVPKNDSDFSETPILPRDSSLSNSATPIPRKGSRTSKNTTPVKRRNSIGAKNVTPVPRQSSRVSKSTSPGFFWKKSNDESATPVEDSVNVSKSTMKVGDSSASIFVDQHLIESLKKALDEKPLDHCMSDLELHRWLRQKKLNVKKTVAAIEEHVEWRLEMKIDELMREPLEEDIQKQIDSEVFLILPDDKLDPFGRPIIMCSPIKHLNYCGMGTVDVKRFIIYYQEKMTTILDRLESQNFTAFLDLKGCKMKHVDYGMAKELGQLIRSHYPERLGKLYVLNYPYFYHVIWYVVKSWLSKKTQAKIKFLDSKKIDIKWAVENEQIPDTFVWK